MALTVHPSASPAPQHAWNLTSNGRSGEQGPHTERTESGANAATREGGKTRNTAGRTIEPRFDEEADRIVVRVKSVETGDVIRQIPTEHYLRFVAHFSEQIGVLFNETV